MLTVKSATFYKNVHQVAGQQPVFSGKYNELEFDSYPVTTDIATLAFDFHAAGELNFLFFIRVRVGDQVIHETALSHITAHDRGTGGDFGFIGNIQGITFPTPDIYWFDIVVKEMPSGEDSVLHSTLLKLTQKKASRNRH